MAVPANTSFIISFDRQGRVLQVQNASGEAATEGSTNNPLEVDQDCPANPNSTIKKVYNIQLTFATCRTTQPVPQDLCLVRDPVTGRFYWVPCN